MAASSLSSAMPAASSCQFCCIESRITTAWLAVSEPGVEWKLQLLNAYSVSDRKSKKLLGFCLCAPLCSCAKGVRTLFFPPAVVSHRICMRLHIYFMFYIFYSSFRGNKTSLKILVGSVSAPAGRDNRRGMRTAPACNAVYLIRDGAKPAGARMYKSEAGLNACNMAAVKCKT